MDIYQHAKTICRPPMDPEIVQWIAHIGNENRWGDAKIQGELKKLGYRVSHETMRKILRQQEIPPLPERQRTSSWRVFLNHYKATPWPAIFSL